MLTRAAMIQVIQNGGSVIVAPNWIVTAIGDLPDQATLDAWAAAQNNGSNANNAGTPVPHKTVTADYNVQATDQRVVLDSPDAHKFWLPPADVTIYNKRYPLMNIGVGQLTVWILNSGLFSNDTDHIVVDKGQTAEVMGTQRADGSYVWTRS